MFYIEDGTIYFDSGEGINNPSVMFDKQTGTLHKYGSQEFVLAAFERFVEVDKHRLISDSLVMFTFNEEQFSPEEILEHLDKMVNNTGYCGLFYKKMLAGELKGKKEVKC